MSESVKHMELVQRAATFARSLVPPHASALLEIDTPEKTHATHGISSFHPDLHYEWGGMLIVGEAKTRKDFENDHARAQFSAYVNACAVYSGRAHLIVAVPLLLTRTVENYFRRLLPGERRFPITIVDDAGGVRTI